MGKSCENVEKELECNKSKNCKKLYELQKKI